MSKLSRFQIEVLLAVAENPKRSGQDVLKHVSDRYGYDVGHGRLYPNLDKLDEMGLLVKHEKHHDNRTHAYEITTEGIKRLEDLEETIQNALVRGSLERSYEQ